MAADSRAFPARNRLKKRRDFLRIGERGRRLYGRRFIVSFRPAATAHSRLGITVSKKVGNAVVRNRVKRWVREAWRQHPERLQRPIDVVITAKRGISDFSYHAVEHELGELLRRYFSEDPAQHSAGNHRRSQHSRRRRKKRAPGAADSGAAGAGRPASRKPGSDPDRDL